MNNQNPYNPYGCQPDNQNGYRQPDYTYPQNYPNNCQQGYMPQQNYNPSYNCYQPQQRYIQVQVQSNGIPVAPMKEEKQYIKRFYNWVGGTLLIHFGMAIFVMILVTLFYISILGLTDQASIFDALFSKETTYHSSLLMAILGVTVYPICNILATLIGTGATKTRIKPLFSINRCSAFVVIAGLIIALGIQSAVGYIGDFINYFLNMVNVDMYTNLDSTKMIGLAPNILDCISTCILAPVTEELLFRGFVLKNLSRFNIRFGIVASALLFALTHGNIPQFIFAFPVGIVLAYVAVKSNSIIPSIIIHVVVNSVATLQSYISDPKLYSIIVTVWDIIFVVLAIATVIFVAVKAKINIPKSDKPKKKRGWPLFFSSAACIITVAMYVIFSFAMLI